MIKGITTLFSTHNILASILLFYSVSAFPEVCQKLEFAELESLSKEELLSMRCDYFNSIIEMVNREYETVKSGGNPNIYVAISERCAEEVTRMERILIKKYALTPRNNSSFNISTEEGKRSDLASQISAMCKPK